MLEDSLLDEYEKKEKCGVFGIWGPKEAAQITYTGLFAQQHRGQESAGIAVTDGKDLNGHTGMGLVSQVFTPRMLREELAGTGAIGHVRYSTTGSSKLANAQPLLREFSLGPVAVAHNGNLINAQLLRKEYEAHGHIFQSTTDTEIIVHLLAKPSHASKADPLIHVLKHLQGAFSLLFLFPDRIEACRDPYGIRPLALGRTREGHWCVASETCAFDAIDAEYVRDIEPAEIVRIDDSGVSTRKYDVPAPELAQCMFEHVYFSNPASKIFGQNVHITREAMGRQLAREAPVKADFVMPMPDSGRSAALGFSKESKIDFEEGIVPNRFVGRTFILPGQAARDKAVAVKLNIIPDVVRDKRVVIVEDSVVRGTTTRSKMRAIRRAGAKEIHLRVSCPPIRHPCFYGIDFPTNQELIAYNRTVQEVADFLEVDSLAYLSLEGMAACMRGQPKDYCSACWSGHYKIPIDQPQSKFYFERDQLKMF
ncbi:amidophosphoribosyltransferase [Humisphaera borealis]|uniref:Amidophosphoribosyltransferase n=1 Tax=Humisphaera borealis TaxID=2807512 RepID=A0A7M2X3S2_9BACT|nr:amidophosphoribosyltransferase [Humisphaera borealis]